MIPDWVYYVGAAVCAVTGFAMGWQGLIDTFADIWNGFLNGFNWIVEHTMGKLLVCCSRHTPPMEEQIAQLERWNSQWNELWMSGHTPVWIDGYGWAENDGKCRHQELWVRCAVCTAPDVRRMEALMCPCGYRTECAVHCGSGHTDGGCPEHNAEPTAVYPAIGVTAVEFSDRMRMAFAVPVASNAHRASIDDVAWKAMKDMQEGVVHGEQ